MGLYAIYIKVGDFDLMSKNDRYVDLTKNTGILLIGNFGSKILSYFLLPLYTSYLSTAEYGTYDIINTTVNLIIPVLTVNASASVMRFSLDRDANLSEVISSELDIIIKGSLAFFVFIALNKVLGVFDVINQYLVYFILMYVLSIASQILSSFARGVGDLHGVAFSGIINTSALLVLNILFLVYLNLKLDGYFLANIAGLAASSVFLLFRLKIWKYFSFKQVSKSMKRNLIGYGGPLIATSIGWWINNASDRYVVTLLCGASANGIYSVSYKIPSILTTLQSIFNQAWQISTVDQYNKNDEYGFFSNIYNFFNAAYVIGCSILILFTKLIARMLFANEFYGAWYYAPFLMISVVFGSLIGVCDGIFQAVKDSRTQSKTVMFGAVINVVGNFILVYFIGPVGAAISTAFSYVVTWGISMVYVGKYMTFKLDLKKHIFSYLLLIIQAVLYITVADNVALYISQLFILVILIILYEKDVSRMARLLLRKIVLKH